MGKFFITTAIPYVNAKPHIGHALEYVQADVIARYHRLIGDEVLLLSGGDENALKNVQAAEKAGVPVQEFIDTNNNLFIELTKKLNTQFDVWQKGSDQEHHYNSSQKLWVLCAKNGDIYQKKYKGLYCVGCEQFYEPEELNNKGECFEHPGKRLDEVEEENYFFKLSKYQDRIIELIKTRTLELVPAKREHEILSFLESGLKDISISRSNERAKNWGVPVPGDDKQRIYVWFDALNIYQSGIGFGWDDEKYSKWWPADLHVIGKGITRFHAVYWPAFLLSAGLQLPKKIFVHEYLTVDGQKMSKTLGNVLDPIPLIEKYLADGVRYYLLAKVSPFVDGDISEDKLKQVYNSDLANGLGNLVARVAKQAEKLGLNAEDFKNTRENQLSLDVRLNINLFQFDKALELIWGAISGLDKYLDNEKPWTKSDDESKKVIGNIVRGFEATTSILEIAGSLECLLPETAEKIQNQFSGKIKSAPPLFPRIA